ncbi:LysR family transcriptional regulator [Pseudomonadota bacterium]
MTNISVDDLKLINHIACHGSFAKAADMLNLTRPSVTRRVKSVEDSLQILLFKRTTRQLELTCEGRLFVEHSMAIEQQWIQLMGEIQSQKNEPAGKLTICNLDLLNRHLTKSCLADFLAKYPKIELTLLTTHDLPETNKFDADLMIHITPLNEPAFISEPLFLCQYKFYASPAYLAKNGVPQHPRDLGDYHAIECSTDLWSETDYWLWFEDEISHQVKINSRMRCDEMEAAKNMALNDYGIVWLPDFLCRQDVTEGRLVPLFDGKFANFVPIYAIYPRSQYRPSAIKAFIHFMRYSNLFGMPLPPPKDDISL